jgi:hypothetical protein
MTHKFQKTKFPRTFDMSNFVWEISQTIENSVKSSCLHPVFGPLFTLYPRFEWGLQSKEVLIKSGYEMLLKLSI